MDIDRILKGLDNTIDIAKTQAKQIKESDDDEATKTFRMAGIAEFLLEILVHDEKVIRILLGEGREL